MFKRSTRPTKWVGMPTGYTRSVEGTLVRGSLQRSRSVPMQSHLLGV
jgi:hypothetical protein